jgi:hypothetical protein
MLATPSQRSRENVPDPMKPLIALFAAGLAVAALAFVADSPILLLVSVLLFGGVILGVFVLGVRAAQQRDWVVPYVATLAVGLGIVAVAVAAIVSGAWGDAPGLVLLGISLIVSVIVGVFTLGLRAAQRSS